MKVNNNNNATYGYHFGTSFYQVPAILFCNYHLKYIVAREKQNCPFKTRQMGTTTITSYYKLLRPKKPTFCFLLLGWRIFTWSYAMTSISAIWSSKHCSTAFEISRDNIAHICSPSFYCNQKHSPILSFLPPYLLRIWPTSQHLNLLLSLLKLLMPAGYKYFFSDLDTCFTKSVLQASYSER